jgi:hypothetical protein
MEEEEEEEDTCMGSALEWNGAGRKCGSSSVV